MKIFKEPVLKDERVICRGGMHWIAYSGTFLWFLFGLMILRGGDIYKTVGGMFILLAMVTGLLTYFKIKTAYYVVTEKRVIIQTGFIYRLFFELPLDQIVDVKVERGTMGERFDYGTLVIIGSGGTRDSFHRIALPEELRRTIKDNMSSA